MKPKAAVTDLKKVSRQRACALKHRADAQCDQVLQLEPNNAPAKQQLDATQKLIRRLQFEAAISSKDDVPPSTKIGQQLRDGASPIERDYTGPRLDDQNRPTADFVEQLLDWFKEGKVIPRRLAWQIVLGAYDILREEPTLVDVPIPAGQKAVV